VHAEITRNSIEKQGRDRTQCRYILSTTHGSWLGEPVESVSDQVEIFAIRTALASVGDHPIEHLGEAHTIWIAQQSGAMFATDDGTAFAYASQRLGPSCVVDTVGLLRRGIASGCLAADEAVAVVARMRSEGRILRRVHPLPLTAAAFT
jgi:predicted nucleic acid-binding protein